MLGFYFGVGLVAVGVILLAFRWIRGRMSGPAFLISVGAIGGCVGLASFANGRYVVLNEGLVNAGCSGNVTEIENLLAIGADPNRPDEHQGYALPCAVRNGHLEAAKALLDHGAKPYFGGFYGVARDLAKASDDPEMGRLFGVKGRE